MTRVSARVYASARARKDRTHDPNIYVPGHAWPHNTHCVHTGGGSNHRVLRVLLGVHGIRRRRLGGLIGLTRLGRGSAPHDSGVHPRLAPARDFRLDSLQTQAAQRSTPSAAVHLWSKFWQTPRSTARHPAAELRRAHPSHGPRLRARGATQRSLAEHIRTAVRAAATTPSYVRQQHCHAHRLAHTPDTSTRVDVCGPAQHQHPRASGQAPPGRTTRGQVQGTQRGQVQGMPAPARGRGPLQVATRRRRASKRHAFAGTGLRRRRGSTSAPPPRPHADP